MEAKRVPSPSTLSHFFYSVNHRSATTYLIIGKAATAAVIDAEHHVGVEQIILVEAGPKTNSTGSGYGRAGHPTSSPGGNRRFHAKQTEWQQRNQGPILPVQIRWEKPRRRRPGVAAIRVNIITIPITVDTGVGGRIQRWRHHCRPRIAAVRVAVPVVAHTGFAPVIPLGKAPFQSSGGRGQVVVVVLDVVVVVVRERGATSEVPRATVVGVVQRRVGVGRVVVVRCPQHGGEGFLHVRWFAERTRLVHFMVVGTGVGEVGGVLQSEKKKKKAQDMSFLF